MTRIAMLIIYKGYGKKRGQKVSGLAIIAVISQLPFVWAFQKSWNHGDYHINVVGTLLMCLLALHALDKLPRVSGFTITIVVGIMLELLKFDYGVYGLFLALIYRYSRSSTVPLLHFVLNGIFFLAKGWLAQLASFCASFLVINNSDGSELRVPRWIWRSFYPLHLLIIVALRQYVFV